MIYAFQGGRCGNQLFVYAFSKKLKTLYPNERITFDFSGLKWGEKTYSNGKYWENSLNRFNVEEFNELHDIKDIIKEYGSLSQRIVYRIYRIVNKLIKDKVDNKSYFLRDSLFKWTSKYGIYYIQFGYAPYNITKQKNKFICGAFEDIGYFEDIREILLKELTPKNEPVDANASLYNRIQVENSVCVSLRKWEMDVHDKQNLANRQICGPSYYEKAIQIILKEVDNPVFVVFSDDVEWAKQIIKNVATNAIVLSESGKDDVAEKLRLMGACKHFIIANSTFCWWAQYLGQYTQKIVISPNRWLESFGAKQPLLQDDWILIDCDEKDDNE